MALSTWKNIWRTGSRSRQYSFQFWLLLLYAHCTLYSTCHLGNITVLLAEFVNKPSCRASTAEALKRWCLVIVDKRINWRVPSSVPFPTICYPKFPRVKELTMWHLPKNKTTCNKPFLFIFTTFKIFCSSSYMGIENRLRFVQNLKMPQGQHNHYTVLW